MSERSGAAEVDVAANLAEVMARIATCAATAGRAGDDVTLVAVGKAHGAQRMRAALTAGQRVFGENRVQEAEAKWPRLKAEFPGVQLHLVGPLQTNKARQAVALFDVIQTVDRVKLARALAGEMARAEREVPCFVQVNTGEERQTGAALFAVGRLDPPPRASAPQHGDDRRLRDRDPFRRHPRAHRHRYLRRATPGGRQRGLTQSWELVLHVRSTCRRLVWLTATQPWVGAKSGRAIWRNIALPRPGATGSSL